jgi:hypothetical protein
MEPMKPDEKTRILSENLDAEPADLDEYERLLSERFATDPDGPASTEGASAFAHREARLAELHGKLFGQQVTAGRRGW